MKPYSHPLLCMGLAAAVCFMALFMALTAGACPLDLPLVSVTVKDYSLRVEVAATPGARSCGLSRRSFLPEGQGMLFVYTDPRPLSFWMKDTQIPLSIAFLDDKGKILSIQDMIPMQVEERYRSPGPARYALEVNQGWFEQGGIKVGDVVRFQLPAVLDIR